MAAGEPADCGILTIKLLPLPGWELIDRLECERGAPHGRPRIKLSRWDELLKAARG